MRPTMISALTVVAALAVACSSSSSPSSTSARVDMQDQCDSSSFNATLGAGTCVMKGSETLSQFNAELSATKQVAAWRFVPTALTVRAGDMISAYNAGGEIHTFTRVAQYGGGVVPALNQASGNPTEAPECTQLSTADRVKSGGVFVTPALTTTGTALYQCCIHPWMRTTVTVTN